jgi:hypothetical protein
VSSSSGSSSTKAIGLNWGGGSGNGANAPPIFYTNKFLATELHRANKKLS